MQTLPLFKPDPSLVAAIRAAIQRHKLNSNATLARRVVAARKVA